MEAKGCGPGQEPSGQSRKRAQGKKQNRKKSIGKRRAIGLSLAGGFLLICALITAIWGVQAWKQAEGFLGLADFSTQADSYPFAMHVLNVGKADSILLECDGHFMLVDGGTVDQGVPIRQYLTRRGVQHLDYLVNTHPDDDHMGGLETVVQQFSVNVFLTADLPDDLQPQSALYASLLQTMERRHVLQKTAAAGDVFALGSAQVEVLGPITMADDTNNNSLVLKVTYGETVFLLMGDAEEEEEESLLKSGVDLSADVLKVGHHGSNTSTTEELLEAVHPEYAAISVGQDRNNLPKKKILQRLEEARAALYRTDLDGTLLFGSDGKTVEVQTEYE